MARPSTSSARRRIGPRSNRRPVFPRPRTKNDDTECGRRDWLNTAHAPGYGAVYLETTKRLPFEDVTFRYVSSEHLIEHFPYKRNLDAPRVTPHPRARRPDRGAHLRAAEGGESSGRASGAGATASSANARRWRRRSGAPVSRGSQNTLPAKAAIHSLRARGARRRPEDERVRDSGSGGTEALAAWASLHEAG